MKDCEIILGDCLEVLRGMESASIDAVITDPPYNVGIEYGGDNSGDRKEDYAEWCQTWFKELQRVCKGAISVSIGQSNLSLWARMQPPDWWLAWWKPAAMGRCVVGFNNWEPIAVYGKARRAGCDVIRACIKPDNSLAGHPCPKPLEWATKQVEMFSRPGDLILDPFLGSGTMALAALKEGRRCVGIERNAEYVEIARKRCAAVADMYAEC